MLALLQLPKPHNAITESKYYSAFKTQRQDLDLERFLEVELVRFITCFRLLDDIQDDMRCRTNYTPLFKYTVI